MHILLVEDNTETASSLALGLNEFGHDVDHADDADCGLTYALINAYDCMVIDRMMPRKDGISMIKELRGSGDNTPVLILSALDEVEERVFGLQAGGDDYLTKPYSLSELDARLHALSRRAQPDGNDTILRVSDLTLDILKHRVTRTDQNINLQPREFRLLEYLMRHKNQVVTRSMLLQNVWDYNFDPQTKIIDVQVSRLRGKIDKDFDNPLLHTVRGAGYMLAANPANAMH